MENLRKEYLKMEKSMKNLLEVLSIKENLKMNYVDKQIKLLAIHHEADGFVEDYLNVAPYIVNNNNNREMLKELQFVIPFVNFIFCRPEGAVGRRKYFEKYYEENTVLAISLITEFILDKKCDNQTNFIYNKMISSEIFEAALQIVSKKDKYLYEQYQNKIKYLEDTKFDRAYNNLKEIALGIKTGYLSDGTEFDELQFWKLAPFKYSKGIIKDFNKFREINPKIGSIGQDDFYLRIKAFATATMPDLAPTILEYMKEKKLFGYTYLRFKEYRRIHDDKVVLVRGGLKSADNIFTDIYGKTCSKSFYDSYYVDDEVQSKILKTVLEQGLPHIIEVYRLLEKRYIEEKFGKIETSISQVVTNEEPTAKKVTLSLTPLGQIRANKLSEQKLSNS